MLGRKTYSKDEIDSAETAIDDQVAAYRRLVAALDGPSPDPKAGSAVDEFEPLFFNTMTLALDRYFVHRIRPVSGKDGNPLNEVELLSDSLINNDAVLRGNNVIKLVPDQSVLGLAIGDRIALSAEQFERLSAAFFAELRSRFLEIP